MDSFQGFFFIPSVRTCVQTPWFPPGRLYSCFLFLPDTYPPHTPTLNSLESLTNSPNHPNKQPPARWRSGMNEGDKYYLHRGSFGVQRNCLFFAKAKKLPFLFWLSVSGSFAEAFACLPRCTFHTYHKVEFFFMFSIKKTLHSDSEYL